MTDLSERFGKNVKVNICPYCGAKGNKKPHIRLMDTDVARWQGWNDTRCGSCNRPFPSYLYISQMRLQI